MINERIDVVASKNYLNGNRFIYNWPKPTNEFDRMISNLEQSLKYEQQIKGQQKISITAFDDRAHVESRTKQEPYSPKKR